MPNGFRNLGTNHRVFAGGVLLVVGVFGLYGSFTGTLAPMLAALFDPGALRAVKNVQDILGVPVNADQGNALLTPKTNENQIGQGNPQDITGTPNPEIGGQSALPSTPDVTPSPIVIP